MKFIWDQCDIEQLLERKKKKSDPLVFICLKNGPRDSNKKKIEKRKEKRNESLGFQPLKNSHSTRTNGIPIQKIWCANLTL
jgi:hypothetical protein